MKEETTQIYVSDPKLATAMNMLVDCGHSPTEAIAAYLNMLTSQSHEHICGNCRFCANGRCFQDPIEDHETHPERPFCRYGELPLQPEPEPKPQMALAEQRSQWDELVKAIRSIDLGHNDHNCS